MKINKILAVLTVIVFLITFIFTAVRFPKWQEGIEPELWLKNGIEELGMDYDEVDFVKSYYEDNYITYVYEVKEYDYIRENSVQDIDIFYVKEKKAMFYITFKPSNNFWNKLCNLFVDGKCCKYKNCVDFDVAVIIND